MILRQLFVQLGLNVNEASFAKGQLAANLITASMQKLAHGVQQAAQDFVQQVIGVAEYGDQVRRLAQSTGLATSELQQLSKAAATEGIGLDEFGHSMILLSRSINAAKDGSKETEALFTKLHVKIKESGKLRSAGDVFEDISDTFSKMPDGVEKTAYALRLFGRSGADMIPVLNQGVGTIEKFRKAQVMNAEQIAASRELLKVNRMLGSQTKQLWREAIGPLLPAITNLLKKWQAWKAANAEVLKQNIRKYTKDLIKVVEGLGKTLSFVLKNLLFFKILAVSAFAAIAIAGRQAALTTITTWIAAAAPFIAIGAVLAGMLLLFDDIRVYQSEIAKGHSGQKTLYGQWKKAIDLWLKPQKGDWWITTQVKNLVRLLEEAIKLFENLDVLTGKWKPAVARGRGSLTQQEVAKQAADIQMEKQAVRGKALDDIFSAPGDRLALRAVQKVAIPVGKAIWNGIKLGYEDLTAHPNNGKNTTVIHAPATINVTTQPGQSNEQIASTVREQLQSYWNGQMESTAAASGVPY